MQHDRYVPPIDPAELEAIYGEPARAERIRRLSAPPRPVLSDRAALALVLLIAVVGALGVMSNG